jgi:hypothetical protein
MCTLVTLPGIFFIISRYPEMVAMQYPDELPMFFINFYSQQLLFFNNLKIKLKPGI